jgi:hypothetical protein
MPRGGNREGAGRKSKGNHLSPRAIEEIRVKIKTDWILKRLHAHIAKGCMEPSAVSAALGLLRKIIPDLQAIDLKAQVEEKPASEMTDAELEAEIASTAAQIRAAAREDEASADLKFAH